MPRLKELCRKYTIPLIIIADVLGILTAIFHVSLMDIIGFDLKYWIPQLQQNGYLGMYHGISEYGIFDGTMINYPPMYPTYLYLISVTVLPEIGIVTVENAVCALFQVSMKSFAFIGFIISQVILYKRISPKAALLWTYCIPNWYMSFVWGQRDTIMGFFIVMMLYSVYKEKLYEPGLWFVALCLLKPQGMYLVVIYILYLLTSKHSFSQKIKAFVLDIALGVLAYLPFIIYEQDILLPFKLYLGIAEYGTADFGWQVCNIFWLLCGVNVPDCLKLLSPILFCLVCIITVVWHKRTNNILFTGLVYMFCLYMFTIGQHDRYVIYHICVFILICALYDKWLDIYYSISTVFGSVLAIVNSWITSEALSNVDGVGLGSIILTCFLGFCFNCFLIVYFFRHRKEIIPIT